MELNSKIKDMVNKLAAEIIEQEDEEESLNQIIDDLEEKVNELLDGKED